MQLREDRAGQPAGRSRRRAGAHRRRRGRSARLADVEMGADTDQEQDGGEKDRPAHILVRRARCAFPLRKRLVGLAVISVRDGLLRDDVLRHVCRPGRRVRVVRRIGRRPGVEHDAVAGPQPSLRDPLRVHVAGDEGRKPCVEGCRVERAGQERLEIGAARLRRIVDALASESDDSVPHFAAA